MFLFSPKVVNSAMMINSKFQKNKFTPFSVQMSTLQRGDFDHLLRTSQDACESSTGRYTVVEFGPLKRAWREALVDWEKCEGCQFTVTPKKWFPRLLAQLFEKIKNSVKTNIISGFRKCGILPLNKHDILMKMNCH